MNKVVLIGRLTKDPELRFLAGNGTAVTNFTLAVNRTFKKEGQPDADFIPVVVFGKQAEAVANYITKGRMLSVAGRIQTRNYDAKDGTKRYVTEVISEEVQFLDYKDSNNQNSNNNSCDDMTPVDDGDIPF